MDITSKSEVCIDLAGARVTIPAATIADMWIERARLRHPPRAPGVLPRIGDGENGATFMGLVRGENGAADYLLWDLGEAPERLNHEAASKWAAERGGSLPTRREQSILFGNRAEGQFKSEWYWSCEQCAGYAGSAWMQDFEDGTQGYGHKSYAYRARAVRRETIQ